MLTCCRTLLINTENRLRKSVEQNKIKKNSRRPTKIQVERDGNDATNNYRVCACEDINPSPEMCLKIIKVNADRSMEHQERQR